MSSGAGKIVCVTGASGYIASWLVKFLLQRGYTVKASVRDPNDPKKTNHLLLLDGAKERLHLFKANLLEEGSFNSAIEGCECVFHTASPFYHDVKDPQAELLDPALKGTLNVLNSCAKSPSVKRVVLTSSIAAVAFNGRPRTPDVVVDETWFSDPEFCKQAKLWYVVSKTLAEDAAWKFAKEKGIDLVAINPSMVIGPLLQPTLNTSAAVISNLINGAQVFPNLTFGWVDVRDVAKAHIQAYEIPSASGRYCMVGRVEHYSEVVRTLQKEEEVKILEHSVEELERTINVLEKKVYEMDEEVERHRLIRDSLELELQALRLTFSSVENFNGNVDSGNSNAEQPEEHISRQLHRRLLELHEAQNQIKLLEEEKADRDKQIKQYKEYISELVLHAEAQASQYQQKYKTLEAMVHEVKTDLSYSTSNAPSLDKTERSSVRTRGSNSPFRCITNLVQQMNLEKDQELSVARHRIEELEALVASQQKEVCMLNTRLAAAESMTHDVIRDLLGVKLDMTNYANLIEQYQVQRLVEEAHQQTGEFQAKEQEILNLRKRINDLLEERESCKSEINKKEGDIIAVEITVEQLRERDQLLSAQNEMLKKDKTNLKRRVAELDEMVRALLGPPSMQQQTQLTLKAKGNSSLKLGVGDADFTKRRLAHSEKLLSHVNDEIAQYRRSSGGHPNDTTYGHGLETKYRKHKA